MKFVRYCERPAAPARLDLDAATEILRMLTSDVVEPVASGLAEAAPVTARAR